MSKEQIFLYMLEKQDKLNARINPLWKKERTLNDFQTAIFTEASELIESTNWKWWKHSETDVFNVKLELVDILHFLLSYIILAKDLPINLELFENPLTDIDVSLFLTEVYEKSTPSSQYISDIQKFVFELNLFTETSDEFDFYFLDRTLEIYFSIVKYFFDNLEDFFTFYLTKLALNYYRQNNEYLTGNYQKYNSEGIEDNVLFFNKVYPFSLKDIDLDNAELILIERYLND